MKLLLSEICEIVNMETHRSETKSFNSVCFQNNCILQCTIHKKLQQNTAHNIATLIPNTSLIESGALPNYADSYVNTTNYGTTEEHLC